MRIPILVSIVLGMNALTIQSFAGSAHKNTLRGAYSNPEDGLKPTSTEWVKKGTGAGFERNDAAEQGTTDPSAKGKSQEATGSAQTGQAVVSFNDGNRPVILPADSPVGPEQTFTDEQGAPICAADIANGTVPVGTRLIMTSSVTGRPVPCTVVAADQTGTLVSQSVNPKYNEISMDQSRGGAGTTNIFGCQPDQVTALEVVGVQRAEDVVYYNVKSDEVGLLMQPGSELKYGPGIYLLAATGASASNAAVKRDDFDTQRNNIAAANLAGGAVGKAFMRGMRGAASQESKMRLEGGPSSSGQVAAAAQEQKGYNNRKCNANVVGGGGGGAGAQQAQSQNPAPVQL